MRNICLSKLDNEMKKLCRYSASKTNFYKSWYVSYGNNDFGPDEGI